MVLELLVGERRGGQRHERLERLDECIHLRLMILFLRSAIGLSTMPGWRLGIGGELAFIHLHASSPTRCSAFLDTPPWLLFFLYHSLLRIQPSSNENGNSFKDGTSNTAYSKVPENRAGTIPPRHQLTKAAARGPAPSSKLKLEG